MQSHSVMAKVRHWGILRSLYALLMDCLRDRLNFSWVVVRPLQRDPDFPPLAEGREARIASTEELIAAAADPVNDMNSTWLRKAHDRGELCAAVFEGDKILSYTWRAFGPTPHEQGLEVRFSPQYVYGFYAYTRPECRCQGLQHAADFVSDSRLIEMGYTHGIGFIETHNYPSMISQRKRGAYRVGYAGYLYLLGRVYTFQSPGAKKHAFGFFPVQAEEQARGFALEEELSTAADN
jgi:hypothetical protein